MAVSESLATHLDQLPTTRATEDLNWLEKPGASVCPMDPGVVKRQFADVRHCDVCMYTPFKRIRVLSI